MNTDLSLYIHWPYCVSKCPYCDFNSHVSANIDQDRWLVAYQKELEFYAGKTAGRPVHTIFFGGGTPSLMSPHLVEGILAQIQKLWPVTSNVEITLEANPSSVETQKLKDFRAIGVNRLSLGIQSLREESLKFLGRAHNVNEGLEAIQIAGSVFDNFSFDLIYALPGQSLVEWEKELRAALEFKSPHQSLYQLTIEPGTAFQTRYDRGEFTLPDDDLAADFYTLTDEIMNEVGKPAYEVSNYARTGFESRHNLQYWRYGDYVGIGPGAHGRLTIDGQKTSIRNHRAPEIWLDKVKESRSGAVEWNTLAVKEMFEESVMMGLRLSEGLSAEGLNSNLLEKLVKEGYFTAENNHIRPTLKGRLCHAALLKSLLS